MDKNILAQYTDMQAEERDLVRRIQNLSDRITEMEQGNYMVADAVTMGKRGKRPLGTKIIRGFPNPEYHRKKELIKTYRLQLELADQKLLDMMQDVEEYVASIQDSRIRQIMRCRYIDNMTWIQVAHQLGGNNTADSCRNAHDRFLKKN